MEQKSDFNPTPDLFHPDTLKQGQSEQNTYSHQNNPRASSDSSDCWQLSAPVKKGQVTDISHPAETPEHDNRTSAVAQQSSWPHCADTTAANSDNDFISCA